MNNPYHQAARAALAAGISIVPPRVDGSKAPMFEWKEYQTRLPLESEIDGWYEDPTCTGVGAVTGAVSRGLECIDFDTAASWLAFKRAAKDTGMWDLVLRIGNGYAEETPNGFHLLYMCERSEGNQKLAKTSDGKTIIETRGEGGYIILAPSGGDVNPDGEYIMAAGGFDTIQHITADERDAMLSLARSFDESDRVEYVPTGGVAVGGRPGDDFVARSTWDSILEPHGWTKVYMAGDTIGWRRPGKDRGISATTGHGGFDLLYVFSTSTEFDACRGYNRFSAYVLLNHAGDFREATRQLAANGYGTDEPVVDHITPPVTTGLEISESELDSAKLHPRCIVENHTYADVAQVIAPGGTGKTTVLLYEAICIALGRDLWGCRVVEPGWTLFCTAEDQREQLVARLREIMIANDITGEDREIVMRSILIWDVTGSDLALVRMVGGAVILTSLADSIVSAYKGRAPAQVVFDPLVSFGASEGLVNDNEQGIVTAARRIVRGLDCCVRVIHHTGKGNAREKTMDQYSGRGGSAMADGSRMTTVLQSWNEGEDFALTPPNDLITYDNSSVLVMARPKLSHAPPNQPNIWIVRTGWMFDYFLESKVSVEDKIGENEGILFKFLVDCFNEGTRHTRRSLRDCTRILRFSRNEMNEALSQLEAKGRVIEAGLPKEERVGRRQTFLCPAYLIGQDNE